MSTYIVIDSKSDLSVKLPKQDSEMIELAATYLAYEASRPEAERLTLPVLADVQAAFMAAQENAAAARAEDRNLTNAQAAYNRVMDTVRGQLRWALTGRLRQFRDTPDLIEQWGVETTMGATGRLIAFPRRQVGWRQLLDDYIAKEESLPLEQQWIDPPLTDFETLREQMMVSDMARKEAKRERLENNRLRREAVPALRRHLSMALHVLIYSRFQGETSFQLLSWGFPVQYQRPAGETTPEPAPADPPAAAPMSAAAPAMVALSAAPVGATTNGSRNGSSH